MRLPVFVEPVPVVVVHDPGTGFEYPPDPDAVAAGQQWWARRRAPFRPDWERARVG